MIHTIRPYHIVASALAIAGAATPAVASAYYRINVDNRAANPGEFGSWASPNNIVVENTFTDSGFSDAMYVPNTNTISETHEMQFPEWYRPWNEVDYTQIYGTGSNMFGIDQVELKDGSGVVRDTVGLDNNTAYCLSSDPNDGPNAAAGTCHNNVSEPVWYFYW